MVHRWFTGLIRAVLRCAGRSPIRGPGGPTRRRLGALQRIPARAAKGGVRGYAGSPRGSPRVQRWFPGGRSSGTDRGRELPFVPAGPASTRRAAVFGEGTAAQGDGDHRARSASDARRAGELPLGRELPPPIPPDRRTVPRARPPAAADGSPGPSGERAAGPNLPPPMGAVRRSKSGRLDTPCRDVGADLRGLRQPVAWAYGRTVGRDGHPSVRRMSTTIGHSGSEVRPRASYPGCGSPVSPGSVPTRARPRERTTTRRATHSLSLSGPAVRQGLPAPLRAAFASRARLARSLIASSGGAAPWAAAPDPLSTRAREKRNVKRI